MIDLLGSSRIMKLSALQQSYLNRRANSGDCPVKSPAAIFWLILHAICCLISLVLGFRFSRLVFFLVSTSSNNLHIVPFDFQSALTSYPFTGIENPANGTASRVVVGRHGIRIRPWPHPDPVEVMKAHQIINKVQREQRLQFEVKNPKTVIAVTPTYVRTFQALHLTGVMQSLMLVPYDVVWVVVEAGGVTKETSSIIAKSGLRTIHVGFNQRMPNLWDARHKLEARMRLHALRIVRKEKLDGVVMFADESNIHSMELFDEIQSVKWIGAVSVGILVHSVNTDESSSLQGPACNSSNKLVGWNTFNSLPYAGKSAVHVDDRAPVLPRKLEWSGFVLNSRLLWKDVDSKPEWIKDVDALDGVDKNIESPLSLLKDTSVVEPLGICGRQVLLWWLRAEARTDSKFPPRWIIEHPLDITVPSKRTPWSDAHPEIPSDEKVSISTHQELQTKHSMKSRSSKSRRSSRNGKSEIEVMSSQVSSNSELN